MKHAVALALVAALFAAISPIEAQAREAGPQKGAGNGKGPVTIRFSFYVATPFAEDRRESEVSCPLRIRRGSDGVEVFRAAVDQDCIRSFRTAIEDGRMMIRCINDVCAHVTNSPGIVPDTRWDADWTDDGGWGWDSEYWNLGLHGFSASDGDFFTAALYAVN